MNCYEKAEYEMQDTIGYWSCMDGVEVKGILYGIEDYMIVVAHAWSYPRSVHKLKIRYGDGEKRRDYILLKGTRLYLDECIRA